jgi:hypothetical protein
MIIWRMRVVLHVAAAACLIYLAALSAADPADAAKSVVVTDGGGKEHKLKAWKFTTGVRRLTWLADKKELENREPDKKEPAKKDAPKGKAPVRPAIGPEAFELREENSTGWEDGILTLLPLENIRSIEFDADKKSIAVQVPSGDKDDITLTGTTRYVGINKLTLEAEVDKGDMGIAEVRFQGGVPKASLKKIAFASPKKPADLQGRPAVITDSEKKKKTTHPVTDLQPLYRFDDGTEKLAPVLMFKKTLKLDVAKIQKIQASEDKPKDMDGPEWVVTMKDGEETTLTVLKTITLDDREAKLEGLLGRVPGGYRLFPVHTISEIQFDAKPEAKPEDK